MRNEKNKPEVSWRFMLLLCGICFLIWLSSIGMMHLLFSKWETRGLAGDSFGAVNALFSGLAFGGVIYAIIIQQRELSLQVEELRDTRAEFARQSQIMSENQKSSKEMQDYEKYVTHMKSEPILLFVPEYAKVELGTIEFYVPFNVITFVDEIDDYYLAGYGSDVAEKYVEKLRPIGEVVFLANFGELVFDVNVTCINIRESHKAYFSIARLQRDCCLCLMLPKDRFKYEYIQVDLRYVNMLGYSMYRKLLVWLQGGRPIEGFNSFLEGIGSDLAGYQESKKNYESRLDGIIRGEYDEEESLLDTSSESEVGAEDDDLGEGNERSK